MPTEKNAVYKHHYHSDMACLDSCCMKLTVLTRLHILQRLSPRIAKIEYDYADPSCFARLVNFVFEFVYTSLQKPVLC